MTSLEGEGDTAVLGLVWGANMMLFLSGAKPDCPEQQILPIVAPSLAACMPSVSRQRAGALLPVAPGLYALAHLPLEAELLHVRGQAGPGFFQGVQQILVQDRQGMPAFCIESELGCFRL